MRQDDRAPFMTALHAARLAAYPDGQYVGQESFMSADEIRQLADRAGITRDCAVLDLCCGTAGPGRLLVAERGCRYLGLDYSLSALDIADQLAGDLPCRFAPAHIPPLPEGRFDVVLLLETMLEFADKQGLFCAIESALDRGGRFAFTVEAGHPLSAREQALMPDGETIHLIGLRELTQLLAAAGLGVTWQHESTLAHQATAAALLAAFRRHEAEITRVAGRRASAELIAAHELWVEWLRSGRVRKYALVAERC